MKFAFEVPDINLDFVSASIIPTHKVLELDTLKSYCLVYSSIGDPLNYIMFMHR